MSSAVAIAGAGHSGSTMLGMMLGGAPRAFYAGEGKKALFLADPDAPAHKRTCKFCGPECPVWSVVSITHARELYPALRRLTDTDTIVDSSKSLAWIRDRLQEEEAPGLVLLTRDGRAVVNSRLRKYPNISVDAHTAEWQGQMRDSERFFDAFVGAKARVRYEDLVNDPSPALRALCAALDLTYTDSLVDFASRPQHVLGGNNGTQSQVARVRGERGPEAGSRHGDYYERAPGALRLDLRWRQELDAEGLARFNKIAGAFNASYAYEGDAR